MAQDFMNSKMLCDLILAWALSPDDYSQAISYDQQQRQANLTRSITTSPEWELWLWKNPGAPYPPSQRQELNNIKRTYGLGFPFLLQYADLEAVTSCDFQLGQKP